MFQFETTKLFSILQALVVVAGIGSSSSLASAQEGWDSYRDSVAKGKLKTASKIVEIVLNYCIAPAKCDGPPLSIKSARVIRGYVRSTKSESPEFSVLQLKDDKGNLLAELKVDSPDVIYGAPILSESELESHHAKEHVRKVHKTTFAAKLPFMESATRVELQDKNGNLLDFVDLKLAPHHNEEPRFKSIKGDDLLHKIKSKKGGGASYTPSPLMRSSLIAKLWSLLIPNASAQTMDIAFIGHDYTATEETKFESDAERFIANLLSYEPYKSRASQLRFHLVMNTQSLGCYYDSTITRLLVCNSSIVTSIVNNSGTPYDKIVVLVDSSTYGGSGGNLTVSYNGSSGPDVFVHEFAHSFARLHDEYNLYGEGTLSSTVQRNCYAGTPPTTQWDSIVSTSSYTKGCRYSNWYRSSPSSLMLSLSSRFFNPLSIKLTNIELDTFAGKSTTTTSTTSVTTATSSTTTSTTLLKKKSGRKK